MKFDRRKAKEALLKRTQESNERKDGEISSKYFRTDVEIPFWKCGITKEDPHIIDIVPFLAGNNYPQTDKRNPISKGEYVYLVECYVHTNIGPGKAMILCPAKNYGRPCPVCEEIDIMIEDGKEYEDYSSIATKRRCVYNIVCYDTDKEEKKGVQVWEVSHKYSEKLIQAAAKAPRGGGLIPFADPDVGKSIAFEVLDDTYRTIQGHKLVDREAPIPDSVLEQALVLDELLLELSYEEIDKMFTGNVTGKSEKEEEEIEEKRTRIPREEKKEGCPNDHTLGVDCDKTKDCRTCETEVYEACGRRCDELEAEEKMRKEEEEKAKKEPEESGTRRRRRS